MHTFICVFRQIVFRPAMARCRNHFPGLQIRDRLRANIILKTLATITALVIIFCTPSVVQSDVLPGTGLTVWVWGSTVTAAVEDLLESCAETAVTVRLVEVSSRLTVSRPDSEMVVPLFFAPVTVQVTEGSYPSASPVTAAANCCVEPAARLEAVGSMVTPVMAGARGFLSLHYRHHWKRSP